MHLKTALLATAIAFAVSGPAHASYAEGEAAFNQGNYWRAYQELETPAYQGDPRAQYLLGRMFMDGNGVNQDYPQAHMWLNLATTGGVADARVYRDTVGSRMSLNQVAEAQNRARTWKASTRTFTGGPSQQETAGYSVLNAQRLLNRLGYDAGPADGAMGGSTRSGILAYQRAKGIHADGRLTQNLFDKIAVDAGYAGNARAASGAAAASGDASGVVRGSVRGTETVSYSVLNTQRLLNRLGYDAGPADGTMGGSTRSGILAYQRAKGIHADGRLTQDLFDKIAVDAGFAGNARAATVPARRTDQAPGYSQLVADVQTKLRGMDYGVSVTGHMNAETERAIREYEANVGMRVTGRADTALLSKLEAGERASERRETQMIRHAQRKLDNLGYNIGSHDGNMDWRTRNAIRKFQSDQGLRVDGLVDRNLLDALDASLQARSGSGGDERTADRETAWKIETGLNRQGYNAGIEDGRIDEQARAAILQYQQDWGMNVDGRASTGLLAHIENPPRSGRVVSPALVTDIERELAARGYNAGTVDGRVDGELRAAVRTWQSDARVRVDGEIDENLLSEIRASRVSRAEVSPRDAAGNLIQGITDSILGNMGKTNTTNQ